MAYSYTFGPATTATTAQLDTVLNQAGKLGTVPCTITGTNTLVLTPITAPTVGTPPVVLQTYLRVSAVAANSNTGAVTANVNGTGALSVYKDGASGPAALTGGEIVQNNYFVLIYDATLNSGAGGYHLENVLVSGAPTGAAGGDLSGTYPNPTVANINGVALGTTTASSGHLLIGSGTQWATQPVTGDATLSSAGALVVTKTNGTNFSGLATATFTAPASWTPSDNSGAALTLVNISANYTRIANMVFVYFALTYPATADTSPASIAGLPVPVPNQNYAQGPAACFVSGGSIAVILAPTVNTSTAAFFNHATAAAVTNANLSGLTIRGLLIYPAS